MATTRAQLLTLNLDESGDPINYKKFVLPMGFNDKSFRCYVSAKRIWDKISKQSGGGGGTYRFMSS